MLFISAVYSICSGTKLGTHLFIPPPFFLLLTTSFLTVTITLEKQPVLTSLQNREPNISVLPGSFPSTPVLGFVGGKHHLLILHYGDHNSSVENVAASSSLLGSLLKLHQLGADILPWGGGYCGIFGVKLVWRGETQEDCLVCVS